MYSSFHAVVDNNNEQKKSIYREILRMSFVMFLDASKSLFLFIVPFFPYQNEHHGLMHMHGVIYVISIYIKTVLY